MVRLDLRWATVQSENRNSYKWDDYDYLVDLSEENEFELLPIIDYSSRMGVDRGAYPELGDRPTGAGRVRLVHL